MHALVFPQPTATLLYGAAPNDALRAPSSGPGPSPTIHHHASDSLYKDDAVKPLRSLDITRTLAAKLCGRVDDPAFNARVIAFTRRMEPFVNVIAVVYAPAMAALLFVADVPTRTALAYLTAGSGVLLFLYVAASLSWDMLTLLVSTFEFWFLFTINAANVVVWNVLFHDARIAAFTASGLNYAVSLCFDANIYTRHFLTRLLVFGSPALLMGVVLTALHYPPDLHYATYEVFGVQVDSVDLLVSGNLTITYFSAIRVFRSQHLVFFKAPIRSITCDMYHPTCQLVLHSQPLVAEEASDLVATARRLPQCGQPSAIHQLKLLHSSAGHRIDVRAVLWPQLTRLTTRVIPPRYLNALGLLSHGTAVIGSGWTLCCLANPDTVSGPTHPLLVSICVVISFVSAAIVFLVYVAHYQRQIVKRVLLELDAWFVLVQLSVVTLGVCDLVQWQWQQVLAIVTIWIWCHWTIFLDAVPPPTRRRLTYSRRFARLTTVMLMGFPLALVYASYFAPVGLKEHDRVIFRLDLGGVEWQVQLLGFLATKLFTLEVWMVRFFWREMLRPADAFKLIKRRVFYRVVVA